MTQLPGRTEVPPARQWNFAYWFLLLLLVGMGVGRIVAGYSVFSSTWDEPAHIGAGLELLDRGSYTYDFNHLPLARLAVALGPWLAGAHSHSIPAP